MSYTQERIEFTAGYRIDVGKWDADKQRVKSGCTNKLKQSASEINADLLKYYAETPFICNALALGIPAPAHGSFI